MTAVWEYKTVSVYRKNREEAEALQNARPTGRETACQSVSQLGE